MQKGIQANGACCCIHSPWERIYEYVHNEQTNNLRSWVVQLTSLCGSGSRLRRERSQPGEAETTSAVNEWRRQVRGDGESGVRAGGAAGARRGDGGRPLPPVRWRGGQSGERTAPVCRRRWENGRRRAPSCEHLQYNIKFCVFQCQHLSVVYCVASLFNLLYACLVSQPYVIYFTLLWHDIACLCWKYR